MLFVKLHAAGADYMEIECSSDIYSCIWYIFYTLLEDTSEDHYIFDTLLSAAETRDI